jgi:AraC-like DNA-binding protein
MKLDELRKLTRSFSNTQAANHHLLMQKEILSLGLDPSALYQELEMTSRFVDTHRDISYSNAWVQLHSHTFYELLYCRNYCGAEYLVGTERYRLQRGDIIFIPPGVSHRPLLPARMIEPYERYVLWLSPEFMTNYAQLFPYPFTENQNTVGMLRTGDTKWEFLGDLFQTGVLEAERRSDGWEAAIIGNTITLLTQIKRASDERTVRPMEAEKPDLLDRIMAYIEQQYSAPLSAGTVAKKFYVSSSTVNHLFKRKIGISFYQYVTQRRLIAGKLLIEKGVPMDTVATQTGFQAYSGFFRAFKQEFGISPRQYRKLYCETNQKYSNER